MLFQKSANGASVAKLKFRIRRRHLKRAALITFYSIVVFATIFGMIAPGLF